MISVAKNLGRVFSCSLAWSTVWSFSLSSGDRWSKVSEEDAAGVSEVNLLTFISVAKL